VVLPQVEEGLGKGEQMGKDGKGLIPRRNNTNKERQGGIKTTRGNRRGI
jgi:hypothetical protein